MTAYERAKFIIGTMPTDKLLDLWETTTYIDDPYIPTVRGWLMDEFEKRCPDAFAAWMDTDECRDEDLRKFVEEDVYGKQLDY